MENEIKPGDILPSTKIQFEINKKGVEKETAKLALMKIDVDIQELRVKQITEEGKDYKYLIEKRSEMAKKPKIDMGSLPPPMMGTGRN